MTKHQKTFLWIFYALTFLIRLVFASRVPLIDDEAYHWSWSRELALSYFDHPGMIAWMDWVSDKIFGASYWGVRFPAFLCYSITVYASYHLAKDLFNEWAGHFVSFLLLWSPFWGFGGYVNSPEPPFMMFWILAASVFWQGVRDDPNRWSMSKAWLLLGIIMGLGLNSKFITALLAPGFGLFLLTNSRDRKQLLSPWPWIGILIATLICFPIFKWNHDFNWPGFQYQFHDRHQDGQFSLIKYLGFLGAQISFLTPIGYLLMGLVIVQGFKYWKEARWRFILCLALPPIFIFYTQALFSDFKPHWSGAAYLILSLASGYIWSEGFKLNSKWLLKPKSKTLMAWLLGILIPINLFIYTPFIYPWLPKVYRLFKPAETWNTQWDLSNEFYGWEEAGGYLNERQRKIETDTGRKPFLAAHRYETTAQAYWGTKQKVFTLNKTRSHYTVTTTQAQLKSLEGQDALLIHSEKYPVNPFEWIRWDSCSKEEFPTYRNGEKSRTFTIYHCKNFQGLL